VEAQTALNRAWGDDARSPLLPLAAAVHAELALDEGREEDAEAILYVTYPASARQSWGWCGVLAARGRLWAARRDPSQALPAVLAAGRHASGWPFPNPALLAWRSQAALLYSRLMDHKSAWRLVTEELELARAWGAPRALGIALRAAGLVRAASVGANGASAGLPFLEEAVSVLADSPARLELARALVDLGGARRATGDKQVARELLRRGLDLAQECGATVLSKRAYAELVAAGARPRRLRQTGVTALTPTERRVACMAAQGSSNKEIAQALFVTQRAVEGTLTSAYRKLGIAGRSQLAGALKQDAPGARVTVYRPVAIEPGAVALAEE